MRLLIRWFLLLAMMGLAFAQLTAMADAVEMTASKVSSTLVLSSGSLAPPALDQMMGGEPSRAARAARRSNPQAVAERAASRSIFENLTPIRSARETRSAFPGLVEQSAGGVPLLPAGQRIVRYPTDHAAQISLPGGKGMIEALAPIASRTSRGGHVPFDLRLRRVGGHYEPTRSNVDVDVPGDLAQGVALPGARVSLTPLDGHRAPLAASAGVLEGSTVLWSSGDGAEGVHDVSTVAKASTQGFDLTTVLLSRRSPRKLYFRVGMPAKAHLRELSDGSVQVLAGRSTLALIAPVTAEDAEGTTVPVSLKLEGSTLALQVSSSGDYLYPIAVDPEVNDAQLARTTAGKRSNWEFHTSNSGRFAGSAVYEGPGAERLESKGTAEYAPGEWAYWGYQTKGVSKIYEIKTETSAHNKNAKIESFLEFLEPGGARETKKLLSTEVEGTSEYEKKPAALCAANASKVEECLPASGKAKNAIHFQQSATASPGGNYHFSDTMTQGIVSISEPTGTHSTTSYNTTSPNLEFEFEVEGKKEKVKRTNALFGSGSWVSKVGGAIEMIAKDPGIGVSATKLEYESSPGKWSQLSEHNYLGVENACQGVQCYEAHSEYWTLDPKLTDGEQKLRYRAEEAMSGTQSLETEGKATLKVDATPPHAITLQGLPYGNELSERPYELTAVATDGEGSTTPSSGIKSIALYVDGHAFGTPAGSCSVAKGECSASAKWTVNGAELGAGKHDIEIVAFDNAGNEGRQYEPISIRHSTPVPLGPGSVDLESGDFSLAASDVSFGSGLTVGRNYSSRDLLSGNKGPLGPQWNLSLTSTESLAELVDGSVMLTAANGAQTIFATLGSGKFESPKGDSNLELSLEENKTTKQKLAYYLKDAAAHTSVKFTQPSGTTSAWVPTKQEGAVASDTVTYAYQAGKFLEYPLPAGSHPQSTTTGPDGNVWFVDHQTNKIGKITPTGTITEYAGGVTEEPENITAGPDGNLWFTSKVRGEISKITPAGTVTTVKRLTPSVPTAITPGPDGKLWFTEPAQDKIGNIATTSEYPTKIYSLPAGSQPTRIVAGPDGNLWFTDYASSKVGKITTAGVVTEYALPAASGPDAIAAGPDGNLWVTEAKVAKLAKITTAGAITEYPLPSGGEAGDTLVTGSDGNLWFAEYGKDKIGEMTPKGAVTEYPLPSSTNAAGLAAGPDGSLWFAGATSSKIGVVPTSGPIIEPTEELAPKPAGVSCEPELKPGCRALKFTYAAKTFASGEGRSEWGDYQTRLTEVNLKAYDPRVKGMSERPVARFEYDKLGRLRATWDARNEYPYLKTTYGYDAEGHLTSLSPPGEEPWTFTYGTIAGDAGTGRLLKAARAPAATELWKGEVLGSSEAPKITGTPYEGVKLGVSNGKWTGSPVAYGYQWEDCDATGSLCKTIGGATNQNYTPTPSDFGHTLVAVVTATNAGSSVTRASAPTAVVSAEPHEYSLPSESRPEGIAAGPDGNMWFAEYETTKIARITPSGVRTEYSAGISGKPENITAGPDGNLWFNTNLGEICKITPTGAVTGWDHLEGAGSISMTAGPDGKLWFTEPAANKVGNVGTSGGTGEKVYSVPAGSQPSQIVTGADGNLWFTEYKSSKIAKITPAGAITEYALPAESSPSAIAAGPDGNIWFTEQKSKKIGKITPAGAITEYATPASAEPGKTLVTGPDRNLWFTYGSNKLVKMTTAGAATQFALKAESYPWGLAAGTDGNLWYTANFAEQVAQFATSGTWKGVEGEKYAPAPGLTLDYGVPLEGAGAPAQMGTNATTHKPEPEAWGQSDDPVEATSIFPADEPQGWPASSYKRASTYYLDAQGRQVNVAAPSSSTYGSIATTEYNEFNDVIRTLTPDNRATALAAGASSAEQSKLLDTQSTYNGEGLKEGEASEQGTLLVDKLGPQHMVKYLAGNEQKESLAREHKEYFYDQGAPGGETYHLLTETTELAKLLNHEQVEVRTHRMSYSGQGNLGWKLRAPTSATVDPEGLNLTTTTEYDPTSGQVKEVRGAGADKTLSYATKFGEAGTEAGKLKSPWGVAVNSEGKLWVVDTANNRVEKFGPEGAYVSKFGEAGSGAGQFKEPEGIALDAAGHIWVADTGNNRLEEFSSAGAYMATVGSLGTEAGKFKAPAALAFDAKGNMWVADTANSRVEKFDKEAKYVSEFGALGSEPGKLKEPKGIAVDAGEHIWVADTANNRIEEFSTTGGLVRRFGSLGAGEGQLNTPLGLSIDSTGNLWVIDSLNGRSESFSATGAYVTQVGWKGTGAGQLSEPRASAFDATGKLWVADSANNRLEQWSKGPNAHDQKTIYYSAEANSEGYAACGGHPEWAGMVCETLPAKQPELASLPNLPVTTYTYNMWFEPETTTETLGSTTRTTKTIYNENSTRRSSETTASSGNPLPKINFTYNKETGKLEKESAEGEERSLSSEYNRLGQLVKYTDSDGNVAKYKYAGPENDFLLEEMSDSSDGATSHQTYGYDETTKLRSKLNDSAAGSLTASYDAEGNIASVNYPYSMCANYARNSVGETTSVQYLKSANCAEKEPALWYSDARVASVHGEALSQSSSLAGENYSYDAAGRLLETQETPAGEGCTTRSYAYDEAADRASLSTRAPGGGGACQTEGGTVEGHNYDEANRLADAGIAYDGLGNITKLPAADAEGHELTSSFYVDNAVASQTQNGVSNSYFLDPEGRVRETVTGAGKTISHYDSAGETVAWSESPEKWVRNIAGIDGTMLATQTNGETPVLQLHDLQGNVVATLGDKAGETKLLSSYNSTEFGVPSGGKAPPKFAWLGAVGIESSLASGVITYGATSYVPQTGRALQSAQVEAPGLPEGSGSGGAYTSQEEPWNMQGAARAGTEAPGLEAARETAALEAAFEAAGEGHDPRILLSLAEARMKGEDFLQIATAAEILNVIGSIPEAILDKVAGLIWDHFSVDVALDWYHKAGQKLVQCSRTYSQGFRKCSFAYQEESISFLGLTASFVYLGAAPQVERCAPAFLHVPGEARTVVCERLNEAPFWWL
jgi:streptogramin lyase